MKFRYPLAILLAAALSACGGGGGSDGATTQSLRLNGVAARDQALNGATVSARCATGGGSATTTSAGAYELALESATLPCVLRATSSDGTTVVHTVVAGNGSSGTANLTPLTELVTAEVAAQAPAIYYDNFGSNSAGSLTTGAIDTAQASVATIVSSAGVDLGGVTDFIGGSLTPATTSGGGDAYGNALVSLDTKLTDSGTTLAELSGTVAAAAASGAATADVTATAAASVTTALQPASSSCTALKSGPYRVVDATDVANTFNLIHIDASAMTVTDSEGMVHTLTQNAACDFTASGDDQTRLLVASSGVIVMHIGATTAHEAIAVPEQTLPLSALAGSWNVVGMELNDASQMASTTAVVHMDDRGGFLSVDQCNTSLDTCTTESADLPTFLASESGGFSYDDDSEDRHLRLSAYRATNGSMILLLLTNAGEFYVLRPQSTLSLPEVGTVNSFWTVSVDAAHTVTSLSEDSNTVTAMDAAGGNFTVQFGSDSHTDVRRINTPFDGVRVRSADGCKASDGSAYSCRTVVQMPMAGLGLTVATSADATRSFMSYSVIKP